eukprot:CAMPEP_0185601902 /NCGR_PEP_ID=MMETSP0436-20130131/1398_1 /TAXON_ID=626734 ORGANISM="Favella taraikaensis, Strain Fe Narragansett Bay" /NCGR_SAMPLE_ID=MMETSP0436 /ASSEMBLY_ACC=CAM_ASM_000390 /LENGTH=134 /DNA_ID=CAMNT_0028231935 /DNA_START=108 /DNA_END=512 /DNA_ORIENTATION=+
MGDGNSGNAAVLHVADELIGDLLQDLLGQVTTHHCLIELDELDDIALTWLPVAVLETTTVTIEFFHGIEVCVAHTDNDDRARQLGKLINFINRLIHVVNRTIRQNQKDWVGVTTDERGGVAAEFGEKRREISRA